MTNSISQQNYELYINTDDSKMERENIFKSTLMSLSKLKNRSTDRV